MKHLKTWKAAQPKSKYQRNSITILVLTHQIAKNYKSFVISSVSDFKGKMGTHTFLMTV